MSAWLGEDDLGELREYLDRLLGLAAALSLAARTKPDAPTAGQLAFHAAEAADFWLRSVILGRDRPRDRDSEFVLQPEREQVRAALERAREACVEIARQTPVLDGPLARAPWLASGRQVGRWTVGLALLHITAHTAEHWGQLDSLAALSPPEKAASSRG